VLTKEIAEEGKHYNKRMEALRVINFDSRSPHNDLGLRGSTQGVFETGFGVQDIEEVRKRNRSANDDKLSVSLVRSDDCKAKDKRIHKRPVYIAPEWMPPQQPRVA
jgi:hypothetical protein